jgi:hypothetical protein
MQDTREAQDSINAFIAAMIENNIPTKTITFAAHATEDDYDLLLWDSWYSTWELDEHYTGPRPYVPAYALDKVTIEGWDLWCGGPRKAWVITPDGSCYPRFQPAHLRKAHVPLAPTLRVDLTAADAEFCDLINNWGEAKAHVQWERNCLADLAADLAAHFVALMAQHNVEAANHQLYCLVDGLHPEMPGAIPLPEDGSTVVPVDEAPKYGWLVSRCERVIADSDVFTASFVITPDAEVFAIDQETPGAVLSLEEERAQPGPDFVEGIEEFIEAVDKSMELYGDSLEEFVDRQASRRP